MNQKERKYPYFLFYEDWYNYIKELDDMMDQITLYSAIAHYGLYEIEPSDNFLPPAIMGYFNQVIRPNIDYQHAKYKAQQHSKERRKARKANAKISNN